MGYVIADVTISMDGFMAGPSISTNHPMGERGQRLHDWLFDADSSEIDSAVARQITESIGAVVLGRRTFEVGFDAWDQQTPYPVPTFVVTHNGKDPVSTLSGVFTFVTDGAAAAVQRALTAADGKNVALMGADITQQLICAGIVEQLHIHVAPVLLGEGLRLFDHLGSEHIELEILESVSSAKATHLVYRVLK